MCFFGGIVLIIQRLQGEAILSCVGSNGVFGMHLCSPGIVVSHDVAISFFMMLPPWRRSVLKAT